ncbi:MAG: hypothetical protein KC503_16310 [Myxococcales bacterium]|nr:hypothetical protein [Myxococcales bacterium]
MATMLIVLVVCAAALFAVAWWSRRRIESEEDYLVAGRRLPVWLAWASLFATWFGAGTLLTVSDEVRVRGLERMALDPIGAGLCLLLGALLVARPLWRLKLLTLGDFYARRFGAASELVASALMIPGYLGWVAVQFTALAQVLEVYVGLPAGWGVIVVAAVGTAYTLVGGLWSVTITDALQTVVLLAGVLVLAWATFAALGGGDVVDGWRELVARTPPALLSPWPRGGAGTIGWIALLCAGALGNLPSQDLSQRIAAVRDERSARRACTIAGVLYLVFGVIPPLVALAGRIIAARAGVRPASMLPWLGQHVLSPAWSAVFLVATCAAVLSSITSGVLAASSLLSQNIVARVPALDARAGSALRRNHTSVGVVGALSLAIAALGKRAYDLLASTYEIGVVGLLVPLVAGLHVARGGQRAALVSMLAGSALWTLHLAFGWETLFGPGLGAVLPLPRALACFFISAIAYALFATRDAVRA